MMVMHLECRNMLVTQHVYGSLTNQETVALESPLRDILSISPVYTYKRSWRGKKNVTKIQNYHDVTFPLSGELKLLSL
jgi:hypothetical protein